MDRALIELLDSSPATVELSRIFFEERGIDFDCDARFIGTGTRAWRRRCLNLVNDRSDLKADRSGRMAAVFRQVASASHEAR